ncbi:MAG: GNAT family N-acetyltransferase [candidate division Zixibacteria bacterium]|nr:GNAT family N-acetyltransferase [candidate division Zixibacteria bacterium]
MSFTVRPADEHDRAWMSEIIRGWGADFIVSRGRRIYAAELPAFLAEGNSGDKVGLLTYEIIGDQCEVVTLDAFTKFSGVGTALMQHAIDIARAAGCRRIWLITTNDNLNAIRFYQRRGFSIAAVHINAIEYSRLLKPSIPLIGNHGIPIRDEIEFELSL